MTTPPRKPAPKLIVLDRDGTLITETGYLLAGQPFEFCRGAAESVAAIATNQSAIGRGWLSAADLARIHASIGAALAVFGARIDLWLHCAEHPSEGQGEYRRESDRRKPQPGMLLEAATHFGVDPGACLSVGDSFRDLEAARRAGMPAWLVATGKGPQEWHQALRALGKPPPLLPDLGALPPLLSSDLWRP
jgi:D-glycero-D-manno-heptose 1,7-bisphosphate phosphatase